MNNCTISVYLAYGMAAYVIASIYYMVTTRFVGTPFRDSLTAKQIIIKKTKSVESTEADTPAANDETNKIIESPASK